VDEERKARRTAHSPVRGCADELTEIRNHLNQPRELVKGKPILGLF
jgi:hypothetical protein